MFSQESLKIYLKTYRMMELQSSKTQCRFTTMTAALWIAREQSHNTTANLHNWREYIIYSTVFYFTLNSYEKIQLYITHQRKTQKCINERCKCTNAKCYHLYCILFLSTRTVSAYFTNLIEHFLWKRKDRNEIGECYKEDFKCS